jgi:NADPH:quinone reductase-like Zn-dependent oxidoreductase
MGATRAVNVTRETLDDVMRELARKEGFDVGLEMSVNASAFRDMLRTMHHGGSVALLGIGPATWPSIGPRSSSRDSTTSRSTNSSAASRRWVRRVGQSDPRLDHAALTLFPGSAAAFSRPIPDQQLTLRRIANRLDSRPS